MQQVRDIMENNLVHEFISQSIFRMDESTQRIIQCVEMLPAEAIWKRPNEASNSIANLILHLCGNIRQYAVSGLCGGTDLRIREAEFAERDTFGKSELLERLVSTVEAAKSCMVQLNASELLRVRMVQGFELTGIGIIIHVIEHYSYHTGQIAFWTKCLLDRDLGFYANVDLNIKNE